MKVPHYWALMQTTTQKIWQRWVTWRDGSDNGRLLDAMLTVGGLTFVVNMGAFIRELVVAYYFGASAELDAFYIAILIPSFLITLLAESLNISFIPAYIDAEVQNETKQANQLLSTVLLYALTLMVICTAVVFFFADWLLGVLAIGFEEQQLSITTVLLYILQPILIIRGLTAILGGVLNARNRFVLTGIAPLAVYIIPIIALVWGAQKWGIYLLAISVLAGFVIQGVLLLVGVQRQLKLRLQRPVWNEQVKRVLTQHIPMIAGALLMGGTTLIDQAMATAAGAGSVASLIFGQRITGFILIISSKALGTVLLPNYSQMVSGAQWRKIGQTMRLCTKWIVIGTIPIIMAVFAFSPQIISLIFERGAFAAEDTALVSQVQAYYILQIPFYLLGIVGVRFLSAMQKNQILMAISAVNLLVNIGANYLFLQWMGLAGIALSTSTVYAISCGLIFLAVYIYMPQDQTAVGE